VSDIYIMHLLTDDYTSLMPPDHSRFKDLFTCRKIEPEWVPPTFEVTGKELPLPDVMYWAIGAPLVSTKASDLIRSLGDYAEILPFGAVRGEVYYLLNCLYCLDIIDFEESSSILDLGPLVLKKNCVVPPLFKCIGTRGQPLSRIFCSRTFKELAASKNILGVDYVDPSVNILQYIMNRKK
jgi:hypothetical protein